LSPRRPKPAVHRLPPMLRISSRRPMTGYSKGARGLFVLWRVIGILTDTAVSPSLRRRQRPSRYAIRAGRNLPDKEFRYLRTVIVTAAVYRGFSSKLRGRSR
jgi:3-oxoacyl-(acyl-carrier-protein) synthase